MPVNDDIELMGTSEVAALLGLSRQRVLKIAERADFPRPLAVLKMGNVWRAADIRRWAQDRTTTPRLPNARQHPGREPAP